MNNLFSSRSLTQELNSKRNTLAGHISSLTLDFFKDKNLEDLVEILFDKHRIGGVSILTEEKIKSKLNYVVINSRNEIAAHLDPFKIEGKEIVFSVPISGDLQYLNLTPSQFSSNPILGIINRNNNCVEYIIRKPVNYDNNQIKEEFDIWLNKLSGMLASINSDIESYNNEIKHRIPPTLKARKELVEKLKSDEDFFNQ